MKDLTEYADLEQVEDRKLKTALLAERRITKRLTDQLDEMRRLLHNVTEINAQDMTVPAWTNIPVEDNEHHATPILMLSDLHLDEVVDEYEMGGMNKYNRDIAEMRLAKVVNGTTKVLTQYLSGTVFDGIVVVLGGDIITGDIHEELSRTNESTTQQTIVHWVPQLASALTQLADHFGSVFVPCVPGNHDRSYKKTPMKQRSTSSYSWIIYHWLANALHDDPRITFSISVAPEQRFDIYGTKFLLTHGDGFRSAGGVGGLYPSLLKWLLKTHQMYSVFDNDFDYALMGHWHQLLFGPDFVVNGSLKGYDDYAYNSKFGFEEAQQALLIVTPEHGITNRLSVFAQDRTIEGW